MWSVTWSSNVVLATYSYVNDIVALVLFLHFLEGGCILWEDLGFTDLLMPIVFFNRMRSCISSTELTTGQDLQVFDWQHIHPHSEVIRRGKGEKEGMTIEEKRL